MSKNILRSSCPNTYLYFGRLLVVFIKLGVTCALLKSDYWADWIGECYFLFYGVNFTFNSVKSLLHYVFNPVSFYLIVLILKCDLLLLLLKLLLFDTLAMLLAYILLYAILSNFGKFNITLDCWWILFTLLF